MQKKLADGAKRFRRCRDVRGVVKGAKSTKTIY